ncbi:RagB/SusD family nutrient uptake outer membrane protein [Chondrinema litorale]|uniref:RagB/SusD family nutrient uptake outer membrane protein n=1 Tax=Chondrinema litorale TaxID=2994555 RepID=UPI002543D7E2|nr:RagB/SusD family nutrient uptake outer membrane protein [Chondrinema litorale]UZR93844.1 RagB/SusD family nutrient uptake outer membrane protein [Chondrinema litorale]
MKLTKIISLTLLIVGFSTVACKDEFLEVLPTGSLSDSQLVTEAGIEGSLIATYSILLGRDGQFYNSSDNWFWGSVRGGDANKGSDSGDQSVVNEVQSYSTQTTNSEVKNKYAYTYEGIARANSTLTLLANAAEDVTDELKLRVEAEVKFLRGHYYFELKKNYNNTPYIDETWDGLTDVPNNQDLWPMIESDLEFAYNNLPETQTQIGRANKWAAAAYLGKAYLYQEKYAQALTLFNEVIASGTTPDGTPYTLIENYADLFYANNDNHAESIFAIQASVNTGSIDNANPALVLNYPYNGGPAGCCGFFQPSLELANSYRTEAGLPLLDGDYNSDPLVDDIGVAATDAFTPDQGTVDPRLDHTVGRRGIPFHDWGIHPGVAWIRLQTYGGPYSSKKWVYRESDVADGNIDNSSWTSGYTAFNVTIIRFADVLLMAAECEVEVGDLEKARTYVNMIRERAANSDTWVKLDDGSDAANYAISLYEDAWTSQSDARAAVRFERKIELAMEGQRFYDLVRWGVAEEVLDAYIAHENGELPTSPFVGADFKTNQDEYLPIPQDEIDLLGTDVLQQNTGY